MISSTPRRRPRRAVAAVALAFSLAVSAGTVVPATSLGDNLPAAQAQAAGNSHATAIKADLIAETPEITSEFDLSADEFENKVSGTARQSDQTEVALPEGTPIYLRYQKSNGSWSDYYVTKTHGRLGQQGAFAFDMSRTDFDVAKNSVELSLGQGSTTEILKTSTEYGAFELNSQTNSLSRVGIAASRAGDSTNGQAGGVRIAPPNLQESRSVAVSQTYTAERRHTYVRMCNFRVSTPRSDGSTDHREVPGIVETPNGAERWVGGYEDTAGRAGSTINVDAPLFDDITTETVEKDKAPQRTTFKKTGDTLPAGVKVDVDPKTGAMKITTTPDTAPGTYTVEVRICFPDGTKRTETVKVTVEPGTDLAVNYTAGEGEVGETIEIDAPVIRDQASPGEPEVEVPEGTTFAAGGDTLPEGSTVDVESETGKLTVSTPEDARPGYYSANVRVAYPDDSTDEALVLLNLTDPAPQVDREKCVTSIVNYGLPLLALVPLGLATQINIPGLNALVDEIDAWYIANNNQLQMDIGIFDREAADYALRFNAKLREWAPFVADAAIGVTMVAAGLLAGTMIYDACTPDDPLNGTSSLQGSSEPGEPGAAEAEAEAQQ